MLEKPEKLDTYIGFSPDSVVSKTIINKKYGTVTLFAFDKGQSLSEHTSPFDAMVHVLEGEAEISIGGVISGVGAGEAIMMPAGIPHAVNAPEPFKMLLTLIRE
jgi:quercetin dioxygenase-like cupin family protein